MLVYTCVIKETHEKGSFFAVVQCAWKGTLVGVWNAVFHEKGLVLLKFTNILPDSNLFRGQI